MSSNQSKAKNNTGFFVVNGETDTTLTVGICSELKNRLKEYCESSGRTMKSVVSFTLHDFFEKNEHYK